MPRKHSFSRLRARAINAALHLPMIKEFPQPAGGVIVEVNGQDFHGWNAALDYLQQLADDLDKADQRWETQ